MRMKTLTKNNASLIVTIDRSTHDALFQKAENRGSTVSEMMRDLIRAMLDGNIKPVLRVQVMHPLEPGTYGFVPLNEEESNVQTDDGIDAGSVRVLKGVKEQTQ